jgi:hypothetical protein
MKTIVLTALLMSVVPSVMAGGGDVPTVVEAEGLRILKLPEDLSNYLSKEFPDYKIPAEGDYNPEMLSYFHSRLIGIHPAVAWGDFNGDKKRDYAFLLITGTTNWGPLVELIVLNGTKKRGEFESIRLGEVYDFKDDYVSYANDKLTKGKYRKSAWYINWDKKTNSYVVHKS